MIQKRSRTQNNCRFALEYSSEKLYELLGNSPFTTHDVRVMFGNCSTTTASNKLLELLRKGQVSRTRSGNIWIWKKEYGKPYNIKELNTPFLETEG